LNYTIGDLFPISTYTPEKKDEFNCSIVHMQKLALTFSFASKHLPTPAQLTSVLPITDLIVATNMGGTAEEIDYLRKYASYYRIPFFIHDHLFRGSDSSRSYTIARLSEEVQHLTWKPEEVYVLWMDHAFTLTISHGFHKNQLNKDLLYIPIYIDGQYLTDKIIFKLSTPLTWHGPFLETPMWDAPTVSTGYMNDLSLSHEGKAKGWKLEQCSKYNQYACVHENYIRQRDQAFKWIFLTAQYYTQTASLVERETDGHYLQEKARYYLGQVLRSPVAKLEHRYWALWNQYKILTAQRKPWPELMEMLLRLYALAPSRAQAIKEILHHYILSEEWNLAYLFSKFAVTSFIGRYTNHPDLELQEWYKYVCAHLPAPAPDMDAPEPPVSNWAQYLDRQLQVLASHPLEGEPMVGLIHHYLLIKDWASAWLFTKMAKEVYHRKTPPPGKDQALYRWRFLFYHYLSSYYCGRRLGMRAAYGELMGLVKLYPEYFSRKEKGLIRKYSPFYLRWNKQFDRLHLPFIHSSLIPNSLLQNNATSMSEPALQGEKNL
jgi:hypothetical protein